MTPRDRAADERGVTLIELLVTVSLLGLVVGALSAALMVSFRTTNDTHTSLDQSNTEQQVTTFVTKDVQAADTITNSGTSSCSGHPRVLETTTRTDPLAASNVTVTYALSGNDLVRQVCGPSASVHTVARNVTSFTTSTPTANPIRVTVTTAAGAGSSAYSWTFEVRRRQT